MTNLRINTDGILRVSDAETAQATIITDPSGIQFTAFYPGPSIEAAAWRAWLASTFTKVSAVFIQAPLPADLMLVGMERANLLGVPVIWCPGQYADQLSPSEISAMLPFCSLLVGNEHEISHLSNAVDLSNVRTITSAGGDPVTITTPAGRTTVQIPKNPNPVDPTGCGDALVAGIAHALVGMEVGTDLRGLTREQLEQAVQCGIEFAQCCIMATGSQAHSLAATLENQPTNLGVLDRPTMTSNRLTTQLADLPRTVFGHLPTPLEKLSRLSHELGGPNIWVKRDDCTGLALGGNKTRKLEYLLGEALSQGCNTVVTFGAIQSNHARQTAAACAKLGLACHLVLSDQVASDDSRYKSGGNVLLDRLFGATLHFVEAGDRDAIRDILSRLRAAADLYVIPGGGSNATGALGYARCALEIFEQCAALNFTPASIVHASSSAGTQAGLLWGLDQLTETSASMCEVLGINVYHEDPEALTNNIDKILEELDTRFETHCRRNAHIQVNHAYRGPGYGQVTDETIAAIRLTAALEGLIFDPVYSGKALAALIDQISVGAFADDADVILVHTGGSPALNVYQHSFD